jgi:hypothetical protein
MLARRLKMSLNPSTVGINQVHGAICSREYRHGKAQMASRPVDNRDRGCDHGLVGRPGCRCVLAGRGLLESRRKPAGHLETRADNHSPECNVDFDSFEHRPRAPVCARRDFVCLIPALSQAETGFMCKMWFATALSLA